MEFKKFSAGSCSYGLDQAPEGVHLDQEPNVNFYDPDLEKILR